MTTTMRRMAYRTAIAILLAGTSLTAQTPALAQATQGSRAYDIPAGSLGGALARIGRESGVIVVVDPALVRGLETQGLRGSFTPEAALERLLSGSGLRTERDGESGYRIVAARAAAPAPGPVPTAPFGAESLDEIVVVGALTTATITQDQISLRQAADLSDVFRQVPSVSVGGSVGIAQKIYVRGLEDSMLNVTVDGAPQRGTLFHHVGRVSIEPELLKAVHVQTGAGEATSGFGAIGGAIRFQTKDAADLLASDAQFGGFAKAGYFTNDGYKVSTGLYGRVAGDLGLLASFVHTERSDLEDGAGNRIYGTAAKQQLGFVKLGGALSETHHVSISYEHRDERASFGQRPNWPVLANDPLFPAKGKRQTAVVNYRMTPSAPFSVEATGYWTRSAFLQDRYDRWGLYEGVIRTYGFDVRGNIVVADHDVTGGIEYRNDDVMSRYLAPPATWQSWAWDPAIGRFQEKGDVFGVYLQDHWRVFEPLLLSYGGRYDKYDLTQVTYADGTKSDGFSFNIGGRYELVEGFALNAGFAQAFRGKEIGDAFTLEKRPGRISLAPNLKPERVDNYEGGLSFDRDGWRGSAVYYTMKIRDVILDQIGSGPAPQAPVYYENVGTFKADGVELKAGYSYDAYSIDAYYNHFRSTLNGIAIEGYEHIGLGNSVGDNWGATVGYRPTPSLQFEASLTRFADLNDIEVLHRNVAVGWIDRVQYVDKPGYTVVDLFATWRPFDSERLSLSAAVYNLFDTHYRAHASVADYNHIPGWEGVAGVYEPGRNIRFSAAVAF